MQARFGPCPSPGTLQTLRMVRNIFVFSVIFCCFGLINKQQTSSLTNIYSKVRNILRGADPWQGQVCASLEMQRQRLRQRLRQRQIQRQKLTWGMSGWWWTWQSLCLCWRDNQDCGKGCFGTGFLPDINYVLTPWYDKIIWLFDCLIIWWSGKIL